MSSTHRLRRSGAVLVALVLAVTGGAVTIAPSASATQGFDLARLAGATRFETAAEVARSAFPDGAAHALVASAAKFPDALAASYLAGKIGAPILLSDQGAVPAVTLEVLGDLGVERVTLIGGTGVLGSALEAQLADAGIDSDRIAGSDRYDTSERIARDPGAAAVGTLDDDKTAILATGVSFADALVAGPVAYAEGFPLLLTPGTSLGADARAALTALAIDHVILMGGTAALADQVRVDVEALGVSTRRIAGVDRYATATALAAFAWDTLGFDPEHVNVATALDFPDAIAGGALGGVELAPTVLAGPVVPTTTCAALGARAVVVSNGHVFGGVSAIPVAVERGLAACAGGLSSNQTFAVDPSDAVDLVAGDALAVTVTDLGDATTIDLGLIDCANVSDFGGFVTFAATGGAATGLGTTAAASITSLNGVDGDKGDRVSDAPVVAGRVRLEVTADATGCVVVVAYDDGDDDDALDLDGDGRPTEAFAVSGPVTTFAVAGVAAGPAAALRPFRGDATVFAQVTDGAGGDTPAVGLPVLFRVTSQSGPGLDGRGCATEDFSVTRTVFATGTTLTNLAGVAAFTYAGPADPSGGDDLVIHCIATVLDVDGNGESSTGDFTDETEIDFDDTPAVPSIVDLVGPGVTGLVSTQASFSATVRDQYGAAIVNRVVTFEQFRSGTTAPLQVVTRTTDGAGVARLTVKGPGTQIDDRFVACLENPDDSTQEGVTTNNARCDVIADGDSSDDVADTPNDTVSFKWVSAPVTNTTTDHDSCVLAADAPTHSVDVEDAATAASNRRFRYDAGDTFKVVTNQGPVATTSETLLARFEAMLTPGDRIQVTFDPAGTSTYTLRNDTNCAQSPEEPSTNGAFG